MFHEIIPSVISPVAKDGQIYKSRIHIPYSQEAPRLCLVGGVGGYYRTIEDRTLSPFSLSGSTLSTLSPEYDMKSQMEFRFSHSLYTDSGTLYSPEYIEHRSLAKIDFLKHLDVSPDISINISDLTLTPDRAILTLPLKE